MENTVTSGRNFTHLTDTFTDKKTETTNRKTTLIKKKIKIDAKR